MEDDKLKEEMMRMAMNEFDAKVAGEGGLVNGIKYAQDLEMEIQIRIDYLKDTFGEEATEKEISKYKDTEGKWIDDIISELVWSTIVSNLEKSENI